MFLVVSSHPFTLSLSSCVVSYQLKCNVFKSSFKSILSSTYFILNKTMTSDSHNDLHPSSSSSNNARLNTATNRYRPNMTFDSFNGHNYGHDRYPFSPQMVN